MVRPPIERGGWDEPILWVPSLVFSPEDGRWGRGEGCGHVGRGGQWKLATVGPTEAERCMRRWGPTRRWTGGMALGKQIPRQCGLHRDKCRCWGVGDGDGGARRGRCPRGEDGFHGGRGVDETINLVHVGLHREGWSRIVLPLLCGAAASHLGRCRNCFIFTS
jgi:hypothetical protein